MVSFSICVRVFFPGFALHLQKAFGPQQVIYIQQPTLCFSSMHVLWMLTKRQESTPKCCSKHKLYSTS